MRDKTVAELIAQGAGAYFFDAAFGQFAELERADDTTNEVRHV